MYRSDSIVISHAVGATKSVKGIKEGKRPINVMGNFRAMRHGGKQPSRRWPIKRSMKEATGQPEIITF